MAPQGPWKYDQATVHRLALSLESYFMDDTTALYFETWAADIEKIHMRQVRRLVETNEEFAEVFERMSTAQASRLLEGSTRLMDTTTSRTMYSVNPKIATLVLQTKAGYSPPKQEIELTAGKCESPLPGTPEECVRVIAAAQAQKRQLEDMMDQARLLSPAFAGQDLITQNNTQSEGID